MAELTVEQVTTETQAWVDDNWRTDLTVGAWWKLLGESGYAAPGLPVEAGGLGFGRTEVHASRRVLAANNCLGPPTGLGVMLAAPTIAAHGSPEQIERYIPSILDGTASWCQLFSEPNAGSDLAGLQCKAERDGDEWIINGQKVWTSGGHIADLGMLVARTDPSLPKHRGLSYFAFPMLQDGVEVRPLREMSGRALFTEVFITDAAVSNDALIGDLNDGWRVTNTTLMEERIHLGSSQVPLPSTTPGSIANQLDKPVTDILGKRRGTADTGGVPSVGPSGLEQLIAIARKAERLDDPIVRDALARVHALVEVNRLTSLRAKGGDVPGVGNLAKLSMSELYRQFREVGNLIVGADGMLNPDASAFDGIVQEITWFSPGPSIYGGTDQIQRNILGERVLGLPKEPGPDKNTPFSELLKN